ncbi:MAG: zinc ribbon domain-containing protein [Lachnospiraceae bacterium]|nr:zinc ribbon domain-containing protein [Lachnospiraceae bacterium]
MAYCPKCGTKVADGSVFCSSCGFKINNENASLQPDNNGDMINQNSAVNQPLSVEQVRAADEVIRKAFTYVDAAHGYERSPRLKEPKKWVTIVFGFIEVVFFLAAVMGLAESLFKGSSFETPATLLSFVIGLVGGIALIRLVLKFDSKKRNELKEKIFSCYNEAVRILDENESVVECIPSSYRYPIASEFILQKFQEGRVTTMSEALDKYDEQLHRWKVEASYSAMYEEYLEQSARFY